MSKIATDKTLIEKKLSRYAETFFPSKEEVLDMLSSGRKLTFYIGIDPTGLDIHLGHTVGLFLLKKLFELGHKIIILMGDFTARIGDPSGKESARKQLTEEGVNKNKKTYLEQLYKIIPKGTFDVKNNSAWLAKMNLSDVIDLASRATVQQMIARDMFQERIKEEKPIFIHEFLYPLLQGYDSVAMKVDGEIGGSDQIFNMLVGRELEKEILGKNKLVIATKLITDAKSGKKLSKTEGGYIAINDNSKDIFEKVSNFVPDKMAKTIFELCTEVEEDKIAVYEKNGPVEFKEALAYELVRIYHGENEAKKARDSWRSEEEFTIKGGTMPLDLFVRGWKKLDSLSKAKDLIRQEAVRVNDVVVIDWNYEVKKGDSVKVGKTRPARVV